MRIELNGTFKPHALMDELLAAFPAWAGDLAPSEFGLPAGAFVNPKLSVQSKGDTVWLDVPDDADVKAVEAVVAAHDALKPTAGELERVEREAALARVKADPRLTDLVKVLRL